ncbi:hypothetical protein [Planktothrix mougeotii]|uniref:Uncharacterized protein n=1 Tax=Planktothrix mougeotii LEGE 06226 TaxID=1828728 RepID=A0ABR9UEM2_9CYAN|nr:hypothetical protein [Planktothrix mougeotii]MBE9144271.1 hypothetical protein [Planktothrix mougeotii LEGE 06226]
MIITNEFAQKLIELDEDTLKAQLAIQEQELANESTSRSASSLDSLEAALTATPKSGFDQETINAGDRFFQKLNVKAYQLMCSDLFGDQELKQKIQAIYQENSEKATVLLAPILASHLGLASSIAVILAVLIIKTISSATSGISSATSETVCELWKTKVDNSTPQLTETAS